MRTLTYFVAVSMDGYIAGPGDEVDVYPTPDAYVAHLAAEYPETMPSHVRPHLGIADAPNRRFDTVVMGRGTYQPGLDLGVTSPYAHLRQYVVSTTTTSPDPAVTVVTDPVTLVKELKAEDGLGIYLAGGAKLAGALYGEIDEVILKLYPVMLGRGVPMIAGEFDVTAFERADVTTLDTGHVILRYTRS
ncbi:dihydrofolate reductase family protein [Actinophytocola gossypii]|uniref:Dihydrofolate reductase family protein n=1 Tax=Actinophytocola gossypii TaxID=2812003 RepID=A0ABT2J4I7_9PSEU|nr:dihydrofolate reductase family protein [Actinophytocola gossypii]MCT2582676.1 dihydrofolate reductase family protein [Actinophytocola gossypii]